MGSTPAEHTKQKSLSGSQSGAAFKFYCIPVRGLFFLRRQFIIRAEEATSYEKIFNGVDCTVDDECPR